MSAFPDRWWPPSRMMLAVGAAAIAIIVVVALVATQVLGGPGDEDPTPDAAPAPTASSGAPEAEDPEPSEEPAPVPSEPLATVPPDPPKYCAAWRELGASPQLTVGDDDEGIDLADLARVFNELHQHYTAAHDAAPPSLMGDYSKVLGYLAESQEAINSGDIEQIRIMITNLGVLNSAMEEIEENSRRLCA